jgi:hypothetical protein
VPDAAAAAVPVDGLADAAAPRLIPLRQLKLAALKVPPSHELVLRIVDRFKAWMPDELMFGGVA